VLYYIGTFAADLVATGVTGPAFDGVPVEEVEALFPAMIGDGMITSMLDLLFLGITLVFVARGVSGGIEKVAVYLMPTFFVASDWGSPSTVSSAERWSRPSVTSSPSNPKSPRPK
jgi:Na+-dependent transporters of the SNF family